jgi:hypothetical protein
MAYDAYMPMDRFDPMTFVNTPTADILEYKRKAQRRWDCFYADATKYIRELLAVRNPNTWERIHVADMGYYRTFIQELAGDLSFPDLKLSRNGTLLSAEELVGYEKVLNDAKFNQSLADSSVMLEMFRTIGRYVEWKKDKVRITVLPPMQFDVAFQESSGLFEDCQAFVVYSKKPASLKTWDNAVMWDRNGTVKVYEEGNPKAQAEYINPYLSEDGTPLLPMSVVQYTSAGSDFWKTGADGLLEACLLLGYHWMDGLYCLEWQSHAILKFINFGKEDSGKRILSPGEGVDLTEGQDVKYESPPDASAPRFNAIGQMEQTLSHLTSLPNETFDKTLAPSSGVAKQIAYARLMKYRTKLALRLADSMNELLQVVLRVYNTHSAPADQLDPNVAFVVNHAEWVQQVELTEADRLMDYQMRLGMNLMSAVDIIMQEQGLDRKEATEVFFRDRELNAHTEQKQDSSAARTNRPTEPSQNDQR